MVEFYRTWVLGSGTRGDPLQGAGGARWGGLPGRLVCGASCGIGRGDPIRPPGAASISPRSAAVLAGARTLQAGHDRVHFDLDEHLRVDQGGDRNDRRHRANISKDLAVDLGDLLPG